MNSRIPFVAAVVGALLIGGATTGGTFASWKDTTKQIGDSITTGALDFDRSPTSDSMSVVAGGSAVTRLITVTDKSLGKTLVRRIRPSLSAGTGLQANVFTVSGGACTTTPAGDFTGAQGATYQVCLSVSSPSGTSAGTSTATLNLAAQQTRGGGDYGWSVTKTIPVTVTITSGSILTCPSSSGTSAGMPLTWTRPTGATASQVQFFDGTSWVSAPGASTVSPYSTGTFNGNKVVRNYRVLFTGGSILTSNTVTVSQDNNGNNNMGCVVNP